MKFNNQKPSHPPPTHLSASLPALALETYFSKPNGHFLQTLSFYFNPLEALDIDNHSSFFEIFSSFATVLVSGLSPIPLTAFPLLLFPSPLVTLQIPALFRNLPLPHFSLNTSATSVALRPY